MSIVEASITTEEETAQEEGMRVGRWQWVLRLCWHKNTLALADQAAVSGTNFLTSIMIGRLCGAEELGVYSLGFSLLMAWVCVQESLVSLPYTICRHRFPQESHKEYAGSVLVHLGMMSTVALFLLAAIGAALSLGDSVPALVPVMYMLAAFMPFTLLREFGRRYLFAHMSMGEALVLDVAVSVVQIAGLAWLASTGTLTATTSLLAVGVASALIACVWLFHVRRSFVILWGQVLPTLQQSWSLGKWLFAWQTILSVQAYFVHWLVAYMMGTAATGVYAACMTMALFSNPLILGMANALGPVTVNALQQGGVATLRRVVIQSTLQLGLAMAVFCGVLFFWGEDLMDWLYDGPQYMGHGHLINVLCLTFLVSALGLPVTNGLMAAERPDCVFKIAVVGLVVLVVLVPVLVVWQGLLGAAYGFLASNLAATVGRWMMFEAAVPHSGEMQASSSWAPTGSEK